MNKTTLPKMRTTLPRFLQAPSWGTMLGLAFFLACLSFLPFVLRDGGIFTVVADFNEQQTSFNQLLNDSIKTGSYPFSWALDLGSSIPGSLAFYNLGSPFFWLSFPFPASWFPYLLAPLYILKYTTAGVTAFVYLRQYLKEPWSAILAALLYAFSSFQAMNLMFNHFHDVVAFFPLLLLAADALARGKRGPFLLMVAFSAVLNFFFFVGEVLFLLLYFLFRFLLPHGKRALALLPRFLLEGTLGVGLSLFLFLPALLWTLTNPRTGYGFGGWDFWVYSFTRYAVLLKAFFLPSDYMATETTVFISDYASVALWLPLVGSLFLWIFLFQKKCAPWLRGLLLTLFVFAFVPFLNSLFVAGNSTYYARWFYMLILFTALASLKIWEEASQLIRLPQALFSYCLLFLIGVTYLLWAPSPHGTVGQLRQTESFTLLLEFAALSLVLSIWLLFRQIRGRASTTYLLIGICVASVLLQVFQIAQNQGISLRTEPRVAWYSTEGVARNLRQFAQEHAEELKGHRFFNRDERTNATLAANVPSISSFISTVHGNVTRFYDFVGNGRYVISQNRQERLQRFLGVRYIVSTAKLPNQTAVASYEDPYGSTYLYELTNPLPLAFCFDHYIYDYQYQTLSADLRQKLLLRTLVVPHTVAEKEKQENSEPRWIQDRLSLISDSQLYNPTVKQEETDYEERLAESGRNFIQTGSSLEFDVTAQTAKVVLITLPLDSGWEAAVNGNPVQPQDMNGLMVLPVEQGENHVHLTYHVVGARQGLWLSLAALALTSLYLFLSRKRNLLNLP